MFDFSEERDNLVPAGTYEATAVCGGVSVNNFGDEVIRLSWKIREDVEQSCGGRIVFDDIRKDKNNPDEFNQQKIYEIIHGGQDHNDKASKFQFDSYDDICLHLNGLNARIDVDIRASNSGRKFNCIRFGGYHPTQAKGQTIGGAAAAPKKSNFDDLDGEVPF